MKNTLKTNHRNGELELLRFAFAVGVFLHHSGLLARGYLGVDYFLMLTGAFAAKRIDEQKENVSYAAACRESMQYIRKRITSLFPYFLLSTIIGSFVYSIRYHSSVNIMSITGDLLFLQNYGFPIIGAIGTLWYLSSLYFALWLLYPLIKKYYDVFVNYYSPMLFLLITGLMIHHFGGISVPDTYWGVFNSGFLRAISGLALGTVVYENSKKIRRRFKESTIFVRGMLSLTKYILYEMIALLMMNELTQMDGLTVMCISLALTISLSSVTVYEGFYNNRLVLHLGKLSSVLFMNHVYWLENIPSLLNEWNISISEEKSFLIVVGLSIVSSYVVLFLGTVLKKVWALSMRKFSFG